MAEDTATDLPMPVARFDAPSVTTGPLPTRPAPTYSWQMTSPFDEYGAGGFTPDQIARFGQLGGTPSTQFSSVGSTYDFPNLTGAQIKGLDPTGYSNAIDQYYRGLAPAYFSGQFNPNAAAQGQQIRDAFGQIGTKYAAPGAQSLEDVAFGLQQAYGAENPPMGPFGGNYWAAMSPAGRTYNLASTYLGQPEIAAKFPGVTPESLGITPTSAFSEGDVMNAGYRANQPAGGFRGLLGDLAPVLGILAAPFAPYLFGPGAAGAAGAEAGAAPVAAETGAAVAPEFGSTVATVPGFGEEFGATGLDLGLTNEQVAALGAAGGAAGGFAGGEATAGGQPGAPGGMPVPVTEPGTLPVVPPTSPVGGGDLTGFLGRFPETANLSPIDFGAPSLPSSSSVGLASAPGQVVGGGEMSEVLPVDPNSAAVTGQIAGQAPVPAYPTGPGATDSSSFLSQALKTLGIYDPTSGLGRNALPAAATLGSLAMRPYEISQQKKMQQELANLGKPAQDVSNQVLSQYQSGQIPAAQEQDIKSWEDQSIANIKGFYARAGLGDSSMEQDQIASIKEQGVAMRDKARQNLLQSGLSAAQVGQGPLASSITMRAGQDQQFMQSLMQMASTLAFLNSMKGV